MDSGTNDVVDRLVRGLLGGGRSGSFMALCVVFQLVCKNRFDRTWPLEATIVSTGLIKTSTGSHVIIMSASLWAEDEEVQDRCEWRCWSALGVFTAGEEP